MRDFAANRLRAIVVLSAVAVFAGLGWATEKKAEKATEAEARLLTDLKYLAGDEASYQQAIREFTG